MGAEKSQGKKLKALDAVRLDLTHKLADLYLPEIIMPKFSVGNSAVSDRMLVQIRNGKVGYSATQPVLSGINLNLTGRGHLAIIGDNGSGKSTLLKAILGDETVYQEGDWYIIKREEIGYLDQHYTNLVPNTTVLETITELMPSWSHAAARRHLNNFLFRKNEEVNTLVTNLSGGEKARLSLAQIAAQTPRLLLLDEITNNLDLETKEHVIQVLQAYHGAMIIVTHDVDFLKEIMVDAVVDVMQFKNV